MSEEKQDFLTIKDWAEEDRPREKLKLKGKSSLSDAELIAILLRTGIVGSSALDIAKQIVNKVNGDLNELAKLNVSDLKKMQKGLGDTKAITLIAALELGRRTREAGVKQKPRIQSSRDIFDYIYPYMADLKHEEFFIIYLNKANKIIAHKQISIGGVDGTVADIRLILKNALELLATGIVAVHNHPSGNLQPSEADKKLTQRLQSASSTMDIRMLDHLIIAEKHYYSFADEGII